MSYAVTPICTPDQVRQAIDKQQFWLRHRSLSFRAGFEARLMHRLAGQPMPLCPATEGSAAHDAWYAGVDSAHTCSRRMAKRLLQQPKPTPSELVDACYSFDGTSVAADAGI